jgi:gamma-glutamyltranspeptidase/glutathione hydrolase
MGSPTLMRGAIAAGHPLTAETGAAVLAAGGNAVDACVAAAFAAAVAEGPLTGPAGGGFLLVHSAEGETTLLDCFFAVPERHGGKMEEVVIDFDDAGTQTFHVGEASVAVPGLVAGLEEAHRRFGSRPWASLLEPALALAEGGFDRDVPRDFLHRILEGILLRSEAGARVYGDPVRVVTADLVPTLERIRDAGAEAVAELVPELASDLARYEVLDREPLHADVAGLEVVATPPPSRGGEVVLEILTSLASLEGWSLDDEARAIRLAYGRSAVGPLTGTTHISIVDSEGSAASLSSTLGAGSGVFRGGTQLNNMLGELDVIGPGPRTPGERLASMMTPVMALAGGSPRLVLGSAGSVRLAGAIAQVAWRVLQGTAVDEAIDAPRIHVDGDTLHVEGGWPEDAVRALPGSWDVVRWGDRNLFFGGVSAVERRRDGSLAAAGDPRRGGAGVVVA